MPAGGAAAAGLIAFSPTASMEFGLAGVFLSGSWPFAMILPGISGSFILVLLTCTAPCWRRSNPGPAVPAGFILGAGTGLLCFSRLLHWLLHCFHQATMSR